MKTSFVVVNDIFDMIVHAFILFMFLLILHMIVISKTQTDAIQHEIKQIISRIFSNIKQSRMFSLIYQNQVYNNMQSYHNYMQKVNPETVSFLEQHLDKNAKPSRETIINNQWLYFTGFLYIIFLLVLLVTIFLTSMYFGHMIPIEHIFLKNMILFLFVGIIEYEFFTRIISKYVPLKPSDAIRFLNESIQKS